ncbi:MAG: DUF1992 domain-containing protein [Pseudomonadota bacterium]|nr:MAG: DUF1992 domain-containing protein [Pseudomonadota bacterium]
MGWADRLAERRIVEATKIGAFDALPGAGRLLTMDEDELVPETLPVAYRVLRNAGCLPPEVAMCRQIVRLEHLFDAVTNQVEYQRLSRRLEYLRLQLGVARGVAVDFHVQPECRRKLRNGLDRQAKSEAQKRAET